MIAKLSESRPHSMSLVSFALLLGGDLLELGHDRGLH